MLKLAVDYTPASAGVLLAVEYVKKVVRVEVQKGDSTVLTVASNVTFTSPAAICRYLARAAAAADQRIRLYGNDILQQAEVDHWLEFTTLLLGCAAEFHEALEYLNRSLGPVAYLVGHSATIADFVTWAALRGSEEFRRLVAKKSAPVHVARYYNFLSAQPEFAGVAGGVELSSSPSDTLLIQRESSSASLYSQGSRKERKEEGKFVELPGAEMGKVVVRFPPEASGYLHVGHAKAALLNQYYQQSFQGKLIMRFDDTNPMKENAEFEKVILDDISLLGLKPDIYSYTSDHFDTLLALCERMIREGHAYADDTDPEQMKKEREERVESRNRNNSVAQNLEVWEEMKKGTAVGQRYCIRAKISMQLDNGCMRDPTMYRVRLEPHVRTGNKYSAYPTYDFACPIVDSVENVTHALRTMEYHDRDEQYYWFLDTLGLRKPCIYEYSRLNLQNTVMSKRKLTWFVDQGYVEGWDDPRFPTVRGVMRRGMTVEGLKEFVIAQGSSRSINMMDWDKIWAFNKKVIDPVVPRYTALSDTVPVHVRSAVEEVKQVQKHPKNVEVGLKSVWYGGKVWIERDDADHFSVGENVTFINWGNLVITKLDRSPDGKTTSVEAELNLDNKDYKKTQKITWLAEVEQAPFIPVQCVQFDHLITKAVLGKDEDFKPYINKNSRTDTELVGDPELASLKKGDIIQLQRRGFYICDSPYQPPSRYSGRAAACVLFNIPDGHVKEMPTSGSKHKPAAKEPAPASLSAKEAARSKKGKAAEKSAQEEVSKCGFAVDPAVKLKEEIDAHGQNVRQLKASGAAKDQVTAEVNILLALKKQYKELTGADYVAGAAATPTGSKESRSAATPTGSKESRSADSSEKLREQIDAQGQKVRQLKASGATKDEVTSQVNVLLALKKQFKELTGVDYVATSAPTAAALNKDRPADQRDAKKQAQEKKAEQSGKKAAAGKAETQGKKDGKEKGKGADVAVAAEPSKDETGSSREVKKVTRLGMEVKKDENFSEWYSQVITKADMIEYYDVSGCYVLRPWAFGIWERISAWFDAEIKKIGFENCYFPMFVSQNALETEKEHISDFAPEVAWVTKSGDTELAQPIAIRPTSETVMYPSYAKWVQSHRDLPIKLNQWCSVVRWEFKHPQPFLRTREFLWQEGHSAYASSAEAEEEVYHILELYAQIYENLLAVPVVRGRKTEKEKFAGGDFTTTIEAYIACNGRAIQAATSHHLGQNFSRMFDISFEDPDTRQVCYAYQNSWGLTTRSIGVVVMVHGDDKGLVLPPRIAQIQVVVVPCGITAQLGDTDRTALLACCDTMAASLRQSGLRAHIDSRDNYSPGWKFNHWELKGVPLRVEIGPRDMQRGQFVVVRRDTGAKLTFALDAASAEITKLLQQVHDNLFNKAHKQLTDNVATCHEFTDFCRCLDKLNLILAPFCGEIACEDKIKVLSARDAVSEEGAPTMGAKGLCIPFKQPAEVKPTDHCICPGCPNRPKMYTLFGRSY